MRPDVKTLIVEDHPHMRALLRPLLRALLGGEVAEAADGREAMKLLETQAFDLILVDINLPLLGGIELIRRVRSSEASPNRTAPILVISAMATKAMAGAARDAGANGFIAKPISPLSLQRHVTAVLRDTRPFVRSGAYFGPDRRRRRSEEEHPKRRQDDQAPPTAEPSL